VSNGLFGTKGEYKIKVHTLLLLFSLFNVGIVFPEETTASVNEKFKEKFVFNFMGNYNTGIFSQGQTVSYSTDEPSRIGLGFRYKKISAQIFIPVSFNFNSFDLEFNSYFEEMYIESFLKHYRSFYDSNDTESNDVGLDVMTAGITAGWIHNYRSHSLSSIYHLDRKQTISNGSFLYGFGMFYTSIYAEKYAENNAIERYRDRKHIIHFGPMAGYSYTWILPHSMFINTGITVGVNLGINIRENNLLFIPQIRPKISFGHHNRDWSINVIMACNSTILLWDKNNPDILAPSTMTVTFSKRF
jgi:hypothetical protein